MSDQESVDRVESEKARYFIRKPQVSWDDLILPADHRANMDAALILYLERDLIFRKWGLDTLVADGGQRLVLAFFGPPGTGKTQSAEALAAEFELMYMPISYPALESSLHGQTAKNITTAFAAARKHDSVLMHWDEADTILGRRMSQVSQGMDHAINAACSAMLVELEQFQGVVVFSTNLPGRIDPAFERRISSFIEFSLPSLAERLRILEEFIKVKLPRLPRSKTLNLVEIAEITVGFSPADLKKVVVQAVGFMAASPSNRYLNNDILRSSVARVNTGKEAINSNVYGIRKDCES